MKALRSKRQICSLLLVENYYDAQISQMGDMTFSIKVSTFHVLHSLSEEWIAKNIHKPQTNSREEFLEESTHFSAITISIKRIKAALSEKELRFTCRTQSLQTEELMAFLGF